MSKRLLQLARARWRKERKAHKRRNFDRALRVEPLEQRLLLTTVSLKHDTGIPGDLVTFDPRVIISLSAGQQDYESVELDYDQDGMPDDQIYLAPGGSEERNVAMWNSFGPVSVAARSVGYDEYTYEPIYGSWNTLSFTWESALTAVSLNTTAATTTEGNSAAFSVTLPSDFTGGISIEAWPREKADAQHRADSTYDFSTDWVYIFASGGTSTVNIPIPTLEDNVDEYDDEQFEIEFSAAIMDLYYDSTTLGVGVATIIDNDAAPQLSLQRINPSGNDRDGFGNLLTNTVPEEEGVARFNVMFSHPSEKDVDLTYGTQNGSAVGIAGTQFNSTVNDQDFELFSGRTAQLYGYTYYGYTDFPGGTIEVPLNNDWWHEGQETFSIDLSATNATLSATSATVTIDDNADDKPYAYVPEWLSVMENDPLDIVIPIRLSNPSVFTVTVDYATGNSTSQYVTIHAIPGEDFVAMSGTATFAPGVTLNNLTVIIVDDEPWQILPLDATNHPWWFNETFGLKLSNPVNARLNDWWYETETGVVIVDEQSPPTLSVAGPATITEGGTANLTLSFAQVFEKNEVLNYRVYWDLTDYQWWPYLGGTSGGICGEIGIPPTEWGSLVDDPLAIGSITLTPTGPHDFPITVPAPASNGMRDPDRFLRIVFEWESAELEQQYFYDPPPHVIPITDDTPVPSVSSFILTPNTIHEDWSTLPPGRYDPTATGIVNIDNRWSVPQDIALAVDDVNGMADGSDVDLPHWRWGPWTWGPGVTMPPGQTSATFSVRAIHDDLDGIAPNGRFPLDETLVLTATADWNGSSATASGMIIESVTAPETHFLEVLPGNAVFEIPDDLRVGDYVGGIYVRGSDTSDGQVISNNGPFTVVYSGESYGSNPGYGKHIITYNGTQSLVAGSSYSIQFQSSDQWQTVTKQFTIQVVAGGNAPVFVSPSAFEVVEGAGTDAFVGQLAANDPDRDHVRYSLNGPAGSIPFDIDPETGLIETSSGFNAAAGTVFNFSVLAYDLDLSDPHHHESAQSVTVSVVAPDRRRNLPPLAVRDTAEVDLNGTIVIDVLANDADPEGGTLSDLQIATAPLNGVATVVPGQGGAPDKISFSPQGSWRGRETFTYSIQDPLGQTSVGAVTVVVGSPEGSTGRVLVALNDAGAYFANPWLVSFESGTRFVGGWRESLDRLEERGIQWDVRNTVDAQTLSNYDAVLATTVDDDPNTSGFGTILFSSNAGILGAGFAVTPDLGVRFGSDGGGLIGRAGVPTFPDAGGSHVIDPAPLTDNVESINIYRSILTVDTSIATIVARGASALVGCDFMILLPSVAMSQVDGVRAVAAGGPAILPDLSTIPATDYIPAVNNELFWDNAIDWVTFTSSVDDPPANPVIEDYVFAVAGYAATSDVVGALPVSGNRSYALVAGNASLFSYNPVAGEISVANPSLLVPGGRYQLRFSIADSTLAPIGTALATIVVNWPNRAPEFTLPAGPFSLLENSAVGTTVGAVNATDPDAGTTLTYEIVAGNTSTNWTGDAFTINPASGQITVANRDALDFETTPAFTITVRVFDDVSWNVLDDTVSVTINLQDIVVDLDGADLGSIPENSPAGTVVGTILPRDWPSGDTLSYSILQAEDGSANPLPAAAFQVLTDANGRNGRVEVVDPAVLNYEPLAPGHVIRLFVQAADSQSLPNSDSAWFTLSVSDVNESPIDLSLTPNSINENTDTSAADVTIGQLVPTDEDFGNTYTYSLVAGTGDADNADFAIAGNQLRVRQGVILDHEVKAQFQVRVNVFDGANNLERALTVLVNDVNESPTNILLAPDAIDENIDTSAGDVTIGTLSNIDQDAGNTYTYSLVSGPGDADNGLFTIVTDQLRIKQGVVIDREAKPQYTLRVNVNDGDNDFAKSLTVTVNDLNDNGPVIPPGQRISIPENASNGSLHGPVTYTDADTPAVNPPVSWSIVGTIMGNNSVAYPGVFTIVAATGQIEVLDNTVFDAENPAFPQSFTFTVQVTDGLFVDQEVVTVDITDVNDNPPIVNPGQTISIPENAVNNSLHGPVTGFDPDVLDVLQNWQIVGDIYGDDCLIHNDIFTLLAGTGQIKVTDASQIDFDNSALPRTFTFSVTVSDGLHTSSLESVTVQITDLNDNAPVITPGQVFSVSEAAANGTTVGAVAATDVDTTGGPLQNWQIVGGNTGGVFQINAATGEIAVASNANLDRETVDQYTLSITVSDGLNTSSATTVTIDVLDVNDNAPVVTPGQSFSLSEDAANGFLVGTVAATDADLVGGPLQGWTIVSGNVDGIFQINPATGVLTVLDNANLDREARDNYVLTVRVSDSLFTSANETVSITITDVNDNAPIVTPNQSIPIPENSANNSLHGPVVATDADLVGTLQGWTIVGDVIGSDSQVHNDVFTIVAATGFLTILDNTKLEYENATYPKSYTFNVTVSDGVNTSAVQSVTVTLTDLNDTAPVINDPVPTLSVSEDAAVGFTVGTLTATDPDTVGAIQNWTILSGNDKGVFALNPASGVITVADRTYLDYETQNSYTLSVQVSDGVNLSAPKAVTINVLNVVEPPEISVRVQNGPLVIDDTSVVDFGETPVGTPVTITFEITNHGDSTLNVDEPFLAPTGTGYLVSAVTPTAALAPGATSTFTVTLVATTPGTYPDAVSFTNNDGTSDGLDESLFTFAITGIVASTAEIDVSYLEGGAFQSGGIIEFGSTFVGEPKRVELLVTNPGEEDLIITWPPALLSMPGYNVNVQGVVFDGTNYVLTLAPNSPGAIVTIDLTAISDGFFDGTLPFPSNDFDEGEFALQLIGRVKPLTLTGGEPAYLIIDNGDPGYSEQGGRWGSPQPVGYLGDYRLSPYDNPFNFSSGSATWDFTGIAPGRYRVSTTWLPRSDREGESLYFDGQAQFNVFDVNPDAPGANLLTTTILNQRMEPDDFQFNNTAWEDIGTVLVSGTSLSVRLYAPNQVPRTRVTADAVRIEMLDVNDDVLRLPGGRAFYTFDVRDNDAGNGIDPRAADTNLTGLTQAESPKVQTVTTISGSGLAPDANDPNLWVTSSGTSVRRNPDGTLTYTPADPFAPDVLTFDYTLSVDPTVVLSFRDKTPIVHDDKFFVSHGDQLTFDVRANDVDPQGDALTATIQGVTNGRLEGTGATKSIVDASRLAIQAPDDVFWTLELRWDGGAWNTVDQIFPGDGPGELKSKIEITGGLPLGVEVETWLAPFVPRLFGVQFTGMAPGAKLEARINPAVAGVQLHNRGTLTANTDGTFTLVPNPTFFRAHGAYTEEFRYSVTDLGGSKGAEPGFARVDVVNNVPYLTGLDKVRMFFSNAPGASNTYKIPLSVYDADGDPLELVVNYLPGVSPGFFVSDPESGLIMVEDDGVLFKTMQTGIRDVAYRVFDGHSFSPVFITQLSSVSGSLVDSRINNGVPVPMYFDDGSSLDSAGWTIDAQQIDSRTATTAVESIGSAIVDLYSGTFQIAQPLDFDLRQTTSSDGSFQLVFNSDATARQPVIQGHLGRRRSPVSPTSMNVTLRWFKVRDPSGGTNYQLNELPEFTATRQFSGLTSGLDDYLFSVQTPLDGTTSLVDRYGNGVYRWQVEANVTFSGGGNELIALQGDALLVDDHGALGNPFAGLPEGWGIGGLPSLWVDLNRTSGIAPNQDDTAILVDPAGEQILFLPGINPSDPWRAVNLTSRSTLPKELGTLTFNDNTNEFTYSAVNGTVLKFRYDEPMGNDDRGFFASLREIDPVVGPNTTFNYHPDGRINTIIAADGSTTTFVYSGTTLTQIQQPGGRNLAIGATTVGSDPATQLTIGNYVRRVVYDSNNRVKSDISGTGANQVETHFAYDAAGYLTSVTLGSAAGGGTSTYTIRPAAIFTQNAQGLPVAFKDRNYTVAELVVPTADVKKYDGTADGASLGYDVRSYYRFDQKGRGFETSTFATVADVNGQHQLSGAPLSTNSVAWDHFDNIASSTDALGRETRFTYDYGATGPSFFNEQYLSAFSSPPPGEVDAIFGNLTEVFRLYHQAAYDYDNEFGLVTDEIDAAGNHTRYFRDSKGLVHVIDGVEAFFEIFNYGTLNGQDDILTFHMDSLGLETVTNSVDANRRVTQQTVTDSYGTDETRTITIDYSNPAIELVTSTGGSVRNSLKTEFDLLDRLVKEEGLDADGTVLSRNEMWYHDNGLPATATDGRGVRTDFTFDARGFLVTTINGAQAPASAETTTATYYVDGSVRETTFPDGHKEHTFLDPQSFAEWTRMDRVWQVDSNGSPVFGEMLEQITRDQIGRTTKTENKLTGLMTEFAYDALDRLTAQTQKNIQLSYDPNDPRADLTTTFTYDARGNLRQTKGNTTAAVVSDYNGFDEVVFTAVVADGGAMQSFLLDAAGNVLKTVEHRSTPSRNNGVVTYSTAAFTTAFEYDEFGRLRKQTDPGTRNTQIAFAFDTTTNRTQVTTTDRDGIVTYQSLDGIGQVRRSVDAVGAEANIAYDLAGNVEQTTLDSAPTESSPVHRKTTFGYDNLGRRNLERVWVDVISGPIFDQSITLINTPVDGAKVIVTGRNGAQTTTTYDSLGNVIQITQPDPGPGANGTADHGSPISRREYRYLSDTNGALGRLETRSIETFAATAGNPNPVERRSVTTTNALGWTLIASSVVAKEANGTWPPGVAEAQVVYDQAGRVFDQFDAAFNRTRFVYDAATNQPAEVYVAKVTTGLPSVTPTRMLYDSAGRQVSVTDPSGNETKWTFDSLGRVVSETTTIDKQLIGGGIATVPVTRTWNYNGLETTYDDRNGRIIKTTLAPATRTTTEEWFAVGGALDRTIVSKLDAAGLVVSANEFAPGSNPATDPPEKSLRFEYDALGRAKQEWLDYTFHGQTAPTTRFATTYHPVGARQNVTLYLDLTPDANPTDDTTVSVTTYDVDQLGRVYGMLHNLASSSAGLWANGSVGPDKAVTFKYNFDGTMNETIRLAHLNYNLTPSSDIRGVSRYTYRDDGRLESIVHQTDLSPSTSVIANHGNDYNGDGTVKSWQSNYYSQGNTKIREEHRNYLYDDQRQLVEMAITTVVGSATESRRFLYDKTGNRLGQSSATNPNNLTNPSATNDIRKANRIFADDRYTYKYDNEGNVIERTAIGTPAVQDAYRETYEWDHRNRLVKVEQYNSSNQRFRRVDYAYDPADRHVATEVTTYGPTGLITSNTFTGHVLDGNRPVLDLDLQGGTNTRITRAYLNGPDGAPLAVDEATQANTQTVWLFGDSINSIRSLARFHPTNGWSFQHRHMDSFGNLYLTEGATSDPYFAGIPVFWADMRLDGNTDLYGMNGRWYDPQTGRYFAPADASAAEPNAYRFFGNRGEASGPALPLTGGSDRAGFSPLDIVVQLARIFYRGYVAYQQHKATSIDHLINGRFIGFDQDAADGFIEEQVNFIAGWIDGSQFRQLFEMQYVSGRFGGVTTFATPPNAIERYQQDFSALLASRSGTPGYDRGMAFAPLGDEIVTSVAMLPLDFLSGGTTVAARATRLARLGRLAAGGRWSGVARYGVPGARLGRIAAADTIAAIQRGGVQTPRIAFAERWKLWWHHRDLLRQLKKGDLLLDNVDVARTKNSVFKLMGELTAGGGREIGLLRTKDGLILRRGRILNGREVLDVSGARRVIAHTHPNGRLGLSAEDYIQVFNPMSRKGQRSTIIVGPSGWWRRYSSNQSILGGRF